MGHPDPLREPRKPQHTVFFTGYERSESSKKINAIERGLLVNQIMPAEVVGVHLKGFKNRFSYHAGLFSRSIEEEFDDFNSGSAAVIGIAYESPLFYGKGSLHMDYLHNAGGKDGSAFRPYRHVTSLWHKGEYARMRDKADDGGKYNGWSWFAAVRLYF